METELRRRLDLFQKVTDAGGPIGVSPQLLHDLDIYHGQAGIWRDTTRTTAISGDPAGATVSLTHRGDFYPDALAEKNLLYHYPNTQRVGDTDLNEIQATKNAFTLGLPVFVITTNESDSSLRDVRLGNVKSWDDEKQTFYIEFFEPA